MGNSVPIIIDVNPYNGRINNYISFENVKLNDKGMQPDFKTYGAIYYDNFDDFDGKPYIYAAFLMNSKF